MLRSYPHHGQQAIIYADFLAQCGVVSLLFTENFILAFAGSLGNGCAAGRSHHHPFPDSLPDWLNGLGFGFAMSLGCVCGLIFGVFPAVHLARLDPQIALCSGMGTFTQSRVRSMLMGTEVALALMVLIVAALFIRSFRETQATDPGFRCDGILLTSYDLTGRNRTDAEARKFPNRLLARLRSLPAVEAASIAFSVPLDLHDMAMRSFVVEGRTQTSAQLDQALFNTITPGYFHTLGIPIVAARDFAGLDNISAPMQAVVNEEFVRRFMGNGNVIGHRIQNRDRIYDITAVVRDATYETFGEPRKPIV